MITDSDMLSHFKFDWCTAYGTMSSQDFIPYFQYTRICYFRGGHASRAVNRIFLPLDKFRQYVYVSVCVLICHIFVQLVANRAMASLGYSTFYICISTHFKLNALLLQHVLK
jgi:hypothetical protein